MKRILTPVILTILTFPAFGQSPSINNSTYHTAIGLRAGGTSGLTIKHFTGASTALEGIIGFGYNGWDGLGVTLLYEKYAQAFNTAGFNWYYGGGGHINAFSDRGYYRTRWNDRYYYRDGGVGVGIDGIVGLEYKINPIPFAISLDLKPFVEVASGGAVWMAIDPGLGIKFTF